MFHVVQLKRNVDANHAFILDHANGTENTSFSCRITFNALILHRANLQEEHEAPSTETKGRKQVPSVWLERPSLNSPSIMFPWYQNKAPAAPRRCTQRAPLPTQSFIKQHKTAQSLRSLSDPHRGGGDIPRRLLCNWMQPESQAAVDLPPL